MSHQVEHELRELFATDATQAPGTSGLVGGALRKVRRRRRTRLAQVTAAVVLLTAGTLTAAVTRPRPDTSGPDTRALPATAAPSASPAPTRSPNLDAVASCAFAYSPAEVARRAFSFDGTVVAFAPRKRRPPQGVRAPGIQYEVTFQVNQWFRGGSGDRVTVTMPRPGNTGFDEDGANTADYAVGTRLLVSGEPWKSRQDQVRKPLDDPLAWWGCGGFTRPYTPQDAALWAEATQ
ncbi:hypothetical protein [Actinoplanes regularis]|uniref:Uncharacterized protein n=1 Tax=Actinoplanes regularis TaxID=52697 RepID=A0A238W2W6_9ACTN|nr:hypothetical protein [Actinoplanes regularis]GIE85308.1 hypothetical protein Are01nite_17880 [Actinoplanes regularis]SNR40892.1 hypothetical protein SAMN06264365_102119 [Actinoplanes regularis]